MNHTIPDRGASTRKRPYHVLVLEDDRTHVEMIRRVFSTSPETFRATYVYTINEAYPVIRNDPPDVIIADLQLPDGRGIDILPRKDGIVNTPLVIMTGHGTEQIAVEMMKTGAIDYVVKSKAMFDDLPRIALRAIRDWDNIIYRKAAERKAQETSERYRQLTEHIDASISCYDLNGTILYLNSRAAFYLGGEPGSFIGKPVHDFFSRQVADTIVARLGIIRDDPDRSYVYEEMITFHSGTYWFLSIYSPVKDLNGHVSGVHVIATDITEKKNADINRQNTQKQLADILDLLPDATFAIDNNGNVIVWNKAMEELTGIPAHEMLGKGDKSYSVPFYGEKCPILIDILLSGDKEIEKKYQNVHWKGGIVTSEIFSPACYGGKGAYLWGIASPLYDAGGNRTGAVEVIRDITQRKEMERALIESEIRYRTLIETSPDSIGLIDTDGFVLFANNRALSLFGYESAGEFIGMHILSLITPGEVESARNAFTELRLRGENSAMLTAIRKNGTTFPSEIFGKIIKDADGNPKYAMLILHDLTRRLQAEEALRKSENRFRDLSDLLPLAIFEADSAGILTYANRIAFEMFRYSTESLEDGLNILDMIAPVDRERVAGIFRGMMKGEIPAQESDEFRAMRSDRSTFPVAIYTSLIKSDGGITGIRGITIDITERRRAEDALRESEARFKNLFEKMNAGVGIYEAIENGEDFIFKEINPAVERIENVRREHVVGHSILEIFPRVREFGLFDVFQRVWETGEAEKHPISVYRDNRIAGWRENIVYKLPSGEIVAIYEDITEKKKAEEALAASEEKFRGVAERSFDLILLTDKSSLLTYASPSVTGMLGYSPEEVIGKSAFEFVHPESLASVQEGFMKNLEGFITKPMEVSVRKKEGGYAILEISGASIKKDGVFAGMQVIGRDITSRKADQGRIAELLKIQEEQVRIINASPAVSFLWRAEENWPVEMVSKNIDQFGYAPDDFLSGSISYSAIVHPDDRHRVSEEVVYNGIHGIDEFSQQYRILGKEGRVYWIDDFTHIRRDADGNITHYEGIILDITERRLAEEALRRSEQRNARLLEAIPDMMFIISRDGVYLDFNAPEGSSLLIPREGMVGRSIRDTPGFSSEFADSIMSRINQATTMRQIQHFEYALDLPPGKRYYDARAIALTDREVLFIIRDITEQKEVEEIQRHFTEKLEQEVVSRTAALNASLQEKVVLLREVHHRVKNNLQIIISLTNLQMRHIDDVHLKQALAETQNRVKAMSLVHEKLYQSEDLSMINFSVYVTSLVSQLFTYYGVNSRKIALHIDIGTIMIDINTAIPLGLVINELVSNVVKHAFPGERSGAVFITAKEENSTMVITIQDTGIGFPEGFDWRHTNSLGLHLVSALVEQVQGSVNLVNKGPGTTFRMVIPISTERV